MTTRPDTASTNIYVTIDDLRRLQYKAKGFSFMPTQPVNSVLSGKNASKLRGRGLNFEELRHYHPGDDIRSMDWKVTQRTGKPHIKVYTEERERNVYLAIDQRTNMFFGSSAKMKSVVAAEIAALIAWRVNETGDRVGAIIFNDTNVSFIPAKRGRRHIVNLLSAVVKKNHQLTTGQALADPEQSFNNALEKLNQVCGHNAMIALISDGFGWSDKSVALIKTIRQRNELFGCYVSDPLEQELPSMNQMVVSDGKHQIQFSSQGKVVRQKFQDKLNERLSAFTRQAKKYRIPLIDIDTVQPVEYQLRKALGARL